MAETFLVRMKPYDKRRQPHRVRIYAGMRFTPEAGWFKVDLVTATYLRTCYVRNDPNEQSMFVVVTEEEAAKLDADERKAKIRKGESPLPHEVARDITPDAVAQRTKHAGRRVAAEHIGQNTDLQDSGALTTDDLPVVRSGRLATASAPDALPVSKRRVKCPHKRDGKKCVLDLNHEGRHGYLPLPK